MKLCRMFRNFQAGSNFFVCQAIGKHAQDFAFARCQSLHWLVRRMDRRTHALRGRAYFIRMQHHQASRHGMQRGSQVLRLETSRQYGADTAAQGLPD